MNFRKLIAVNRCWKVNDAGLLTFRVLISASLFVHHGWEKISGFSVMAPHFMDPVGIGPVPSLAFAAFADAICAVLVILGLGTRAAAFFILANLAVVYVIVHNALGLGFIHPAAPPAMPGMPAPPPMPGGGDHVEMIFCYLAGFLLLLIAGGGKFSLDRWIGGAPCTCESDE